MGNVLLLINRQPVAQSMMCKMGDSSEVDIIYNQDYTQAEDIVVNCSVDTVLMEIAESGTHDACFCLSLCLRLRKIRPRLKLLILCSEQDDTCVEAVIEARRDGRIDDFLFFDATTDYIVSKTLMA